LQDLLFEPLPLTVRPFRGSRRSAFFAAIRPSRSSQGPSGSSAQEKNAPTFIPLCAMSGIAACHHFELSSAKPPAFPRSYGQRR
jgi:hypothetical protein